MKKTIVMLVIGLEAFAVVLLSRVVNAAEAKRPVIGFPSRSPNVLVLHIAETKGFFRDEAVSPMLVQMRADVAAVAMMSGEIHYNVGFAAPMSAMFRGTPFKFIAILSRLLHVVVSRPDFKTASDLKNRKFGVSRIEGGDHLQARAILRAKGADPKDIQFINLGVPDQGRMLAAQQGLVDAIAVSPPNPFILQKQGFNIIGGPKDLKVGELAQAISVTDSYVRDNPEDVKKVLRGIIRSVRFIHEQRSETIAIMARWLNLTPDLSAVSYDAIVPVFSPDGAYSDAEIQSSMDTVRVSMGLNKSLPLSQVRDFTILRQVQSELGLRQK